MTTRSQSPDNELRFVIYLPSFSPLRHSREAPAATRKQKLPVRGRVPFRHNNTPARPPENGSPGPPRTRYTDRSSDSLPFHEFPSVPSLADLSGIALH